MTLRFDHAVILVNELYSAIDHYRALGFNAFYGGEHTDGKTHNALIVFQDGSYLELLAPTSPDLLKAVDPNNRGSFLFIFQYGEGFGGYALLADDLEAEVEAMQVRGVNVQMRPPGGRARPDGQMLQWRSAMIGESMTPFFIQDDSPRVLRVPNDPEKTGQPNGAMGVAGLHIYTADLKAGIERYEAILGISPTEASFTLRSCQIRLTEATSQQGDKLAALQLHAGENRILDRTISHNALLELVK